MRTLFFSITILLSYFAHGNSDSLLLEYNIAKKSSDIEKQAIILKELSSFYYYEVSNYDSSIFFAKKAIPLFKQIEDEKNLALCYKYLGYNYVDAQEFELGISYLDSALPIFEHNKSWLSVIQVHSNKGIAYSYIEAPTKSVKSFEKALGYSHKINDSSHIAINTLNLGIMASRTANYSKAIMFLLDAKDKFSALKDSATLVNTLLEIGDVYDAWDKKDLSFEFYLAAYKLRKHIKHKTILVSLYDVLGNAYMERKEKELALNLINEALRISDSIDYKSGIAQCLYRLGTFKFAEGKYKEAKEHYLQSLQIEKEIGSLEDIIYMQKELGKCFVQLGQFDKAIELLLSTEQSAEENNLIELRKDCIYELFKAYKSLKLFDKALHYFESYNTLEDSVYSKEHQLKIEELREKYEAEKKEHQIDALNGEKKLQTERLNRRTFQAIALLIVFTLLAVIGVMFYWQRRRNFQNKQLVMQQRLFRSQMNPHFMFNALNAIKNFTLKNKGIEAADYIVDFSRLMRLILESSAEEIVSLKDEINLLESYLKLQQLRFQNKFEFSIDVDENIDVENIGFPPMLLQPFVENAVEHGIKRGGEKISIQAAKEKNNLLVKILDDGPGITANSVKKSDHKSRATNITIDRLKSLKKASNWMIEFTVENRNNNSNSSSGTQVTFIIPIKMHN